MIKGSEANVSYGCLLINSHSLVQRAMNLEFRIKRTYERDESCKGWKEEDRQTCAGVLKLTEDSSLWAVESATT